MSHLSAILAGIQAAVGDVFTRSGAPLALITLDAVRNPDNTGHRVTLVIDVPDAIADTAALRGDGEG